MDGEFFKRCNCRKHLRWCHNGGQYRQSAKTRSWAQAEAKRRKLEARFGEGATALVVVDSSRITIQQAVDLFVSKKRSKGCKEDGLKKYIRELNRLRVFFAGHGTIFVNEIEESALIEFRGEWAKSYPSTQTRQKVQERIRGFLRFCHSNGWLDRLPELDTIIMDEIPTLPLNEAQYKKLRQTIAEVIPDTDKARRVHALIQPMKHSGLAIGDAVALERDEIKRDATCYQITPSRQKTGVHCPDS